MTPGVAATPARPGQLPSHAACEAATRSLREARQLHSGQLNLAESRALAAPLRGLCLVCASTASSLPLRRDDRADGTTAGHGSSTVLPLSLLDELAHAIDRYAEVLRRAAELGGAAELRTQLVSALVTASRVRFYVDGSVSAPDCSSSALCADGDWVFGVLSRIRRAAAAVTSDAARANEALYPLDLGIRGRRRADISASGGTDASLCLLKLAGAAISWRRALQREPAAAAAFARCCAALADHAHRLLIQAEGPPALDRAETALLTPRRPAGAAAAQTVNAGAGGDSINGDGPASCLALRCAASHMEGHCLLCMKKDGGARSAALLSFADALRARCELDRCAVAAQAPQQVSVPSLTELVALHASARSHAIIDASKSSDSSCGSRGIALVVESGLPLERCATAAIAELNELDPMPRACARARGDVSGRVAACGGVAEYR